MTTEPTAADHPASRGMELRRVPPSGLDLTLGRLRQLPEGAVAQKLASLKSKGQLTPLVAAEHDGTLVLIDGFVRQLAAIRLGLAQVLVEVVQLSAVQMKAQVYLRNRERGLLLLEECRLVRELHDLDGLNQVEIGALLERHKTWVCRRLALYHSLSPHLLCDLALGLLTPGSLRRLARLPARNQEELVAVARRHELSPRDTATLVDLWRRATEPDARQYLLQHPREAIALTRGAARREADPRLGEAAQELVSRLERLTVAGLRVRSRVHDGLGDAPPEGIKILEEAHRHAEQACSAALELVEGWLRQRQEVNAP